MSDNDLADIVKYTRHDYVSDFIDLLLGISAPKILFWFSTRSPTYADNYDGFPRGVFNDYPQLVNSMMVEELIPYSDHYVECISETGLPQILWSSGQSIDGAISRQGVLENKRYPSPAMHVLAADALESACRQFLGRYVHDDSMGAVKRFVIVAAERTGTNLLIGLMQDYPDCFTGGELFNSGQIARDIIQWHDVQEIDMPSLLNLRKDDPISFWEALCTSSAARGYRAVGFKLLYPAGLSHEQLLKHIADDRTIAIIHLKRRNLLRRLISERQALSTQTWFLGAAAPSPNWPAIEITMNDIVASIVKTQHNQATFDSMFANHAVLRLVYEDLAERPVQVAERVARFLGVLTQSSKPTVKYKKTGVENLSDAIVGYDFLRGKIRRWASFFDT
jgi:LPS sulfotransferase NodH